MGTRTFEQYRKTSHFRPYYGQEMLRKAIERIPPKDSDPFFEVFPPGETFAMIVIDVINRDQIKPSEFQDLMGMRYTECLGVLRSYGL